MQKYRYVDTNVEIISWAFIDPLFHYMVQHNFVYSEFVKGKNIKIWISFLVSLSLKMVFLLLSLLKNVEWPACILLHFLQSKEKIWRIWVLQKNLCLSEFFKSVDTKISLSESLSQKLLMMKSRLTRCKNWEFSSWKTFLCCKIILIKLIVTKFQQLQEFGSHFLELLKCYWNSITKSNFVIIKNSMFQQLFSSLWPRGLYFSTIFSLCNKIWDISQSSSPRKRLRHVFFKKDREPPENGGPP